MTSLRSVVFLLSALCFLATLKANPARLHRNLSSNEILRHELLKEDGDDEGDTTSMSTVTVDTSTTTTTDGTTTTTTDGTTTTTTDGTTTTTTDGTTTTTTDGTTTTTTDGTTTTTTDGTTTTTTDETTTTTTEGTTTTTTEGTTTTTTEGTTTTEITTTDGDTTITPTPTPKPSKPDIPDYTISDDNHKRCIIAKIKITLSVKYLAIDGDKQVNKTTEVPVPANAKAVGYCNGDNGTLNGDDIRGPVLVLTWFWTSPKAAPLPVRDNYVVVNFRSDKDESAITNIKASVTQRDDKYFPNAANPASKSTVDVDINDYTSDSKESYTCNAKRTYKGSNDNQVTLENVRFQIGDNLPNKFSDGADCEDHPNNTVAIAVGVTIAVLVILVLAGFLFKRHRDRKRSKYA